MIVRLWVVLVLCSGCDLIFLDRNVLTDCPDTYTNVAKERTLYRLVVAPTAKWLDAQADCVDDSPKPITHLMVVDEFTEIDSIYTISPKTRQLWIGYARDLRGDPKQFFAVTGAPLDPTSSLWAGMEPNNNMNSGETAVDLEDRGFNDTGPDGMKAYVCECDGDASRTFDFTTP